MLPLGAPRLTRIDVRWQIELQGVLPVGKNSSAIQGFDLDAFMSCASKYLHYFKHKGDQRKAKANQQLKPRTTSTQPLQTLNV
jgi:hypothetical protein